MRGVARDEPSSHRHRAVDAEPTGNRMRRGPPRTLRSRAIGLLARREYSRAELRARLLGERAPEGAPDTAAVDVLLDELTAEGLLSDARFAQSLVRRKAGSHSRRAIT